MKANERCANLYHSKDKLASCFTWDGTVFTDGDKNKFLCNVDFLSGTHNHRVRIATQSASSLQMKHGRNVRYG